MKVMSQGLNSSVVSRESKLTPLPKWRLSLLHGCVTAFSGCTRYSEEPAPEERKLMPLMKFAPPSATIATFWLKLKETPLTTVNWQVVCSTTGDVSRDPLSISHCAGALAFPTTGQKRESSNE